MKKGAKKEREKRKKETKKERNLKKERKNKRKKENKKERVNLYLAYNRTLSLLRGSSKKKYCGKWDKCVLKLNDCYYCAKI